MTSARVPSAEDRALCILGQRSIHTTPTPYRSSGAEVDAPRSSRTIEASLDSLHKSLAVRAEPVQPENHSLVQSCTMRRFSEDMRAISSDLARSPLFASIRPGKRKLKDELLPSPDGVSIHYRGEQLDQADCDVFMQLIHEARGQVVGPHSPIRINRADLLVQTGRDVGGRNYQWLAASLSRLRDCRLTIENKRHRLETSLILKILTDKAEGTFEVLFDPDIVKMFLGNEYTLVEWKKRKMFSKRVDLAKWLHAFTSSHARGRQRWKIATLLTLCGYASPLRKFREALTEALGELARLDIITGVSFYENDTKVRWVRL